MGVLGIAEGLAVGRESRTPGNVFVFRGWGAEDFEVVMWPGSVTVEEGSRLDMSQPPGA